MNNKLELRICEDIIEDCCEYLQMENLTVGYDNEDIVQEKDKPLIISVWERLYNKNIPTNLSVIANVLKAAQYGLSGKNSKSYYGMILFLKDNKFTYNEIIDDKFIKAIRKMGTEAAYIMDNLETQNTFLATYLGHEFLVINTQLPILNNRTDADIMQFYFYKRGYYYQIHAKCKRLKELLPEVGFTKDGEIYKFYSDKIIFTLKK